MQNSFVGLCCVLLVAGVVGAADVQVDYDSAVDFSAIKTFQYMETEDSSIENPMMHDRLVTIIKETLEGEGLQQVESDPDIFVTYHATTEDQSTFTTSGFGYGGWGGPRRRWGGMGGGMSTTTEHTYTQGTLLVDAWSSETEKMVWRGISSQTLKAKPEKQEKQMKKALTKMANQWEKIKKSQSK